MGQVLLFFLASLNSEQLQTTSEKNTQLIYKMLTQQRAPPQAFLDADSNDFFSYYLMIADLRHS